MHMDHKYSVDNWRRISFVVSSKSAHTAEIRS